MEEPGDPDPNDTPVPNKSSRRLWKQQDIEEFQVPDARFEPPEAVHTTLHYFKMLFTSDMIEHIAHHTNFYSAQ